MAYYSRRKCTNPEGVTPPCNRADMDCPKTPEKHFCRAHAQVSPASGSTSTSFRRSLPMFPSLETYSSSVELFEAPSRPGQLVDPSLPVSLHPPDMPSLVPPRDSHTYSLHNLNVSPTATERLRRQRDDEHLEQNLANLIHTQMQNDLHYFSRPGRMMNRYVKAKKPRFR